MAPVLVGIAASALWGCGSGGTTTTTPRPPGVAFATASHVKAGTPKSAVIDRLGTSVLISQPTGSEPGGCIYYAMKGRPLSDAWQFCLDGHDRVAGGATLYSPSHPPPPSGASAARAVLISRGDAICENQNADLGGPTRRLAGVVKQLSPGSPPDLRARAASLMRRFVDVLEHTRSQLAAFVAPDDERSTLADYLSSLRAQVAVLGEAARALAAGGDQRYVALRERLNRLADAATADARAYGFVTCTAVKFS